MLDYIKSLLARKGWWKGSVTIPYNLMWVVVVIGIILLPVVLAVAVAAAILFGLWWLLCQLGKALVGLWKWLLPLLIAFWMWLKSLFHKPQKSTEKKRRDWRWLWWLLLALLVLLLLGLLKDCSCSEERTAVPVPATVAAIQEDSQTWNDALYARVFLDGLKEDATLAGYRYRNGRPASEAEYNGQAAAEAWQVMAEEWLPVLQSNIKVELTPSQKIAALLYALRSGKYGFAKSDFVKHVNAGEMGRASENLLKVHRANGSIRQAGSELKSYLFVIRLIWDGEISIEEIKDCHCFAYRAYPVRQGYQPRRLVEVIKTQNPHHAATPRELLDR